MVDIAKTIRRSEDGGFSVCFSDAPPSAACPSNGDAQYWQYAASSVLLRPPSATYATRYRDRMPRQAHSPQTRSPSPGGPTRDHAVEVAPETAQQQADQPCLRAGPAADLHPQPASAACRSRQATVEFAERRKLTSGSRPHEPLCTARFKRENARPAPPGAATSRTTAGSRACSAPNSPLLRWTGHGCR